MSTRLSTSKKSHIKVGESDRKNWPVVYTNVLDDNLRQILNEFNRGLLSKISAGCDASRNRFQKPDL